MLMQLPENQKLSCKPTAWKRRVETRALLSNAVTEEYGYENTVLLMSWTIVETGKQVALLKVSRTCKGVAAAA